jgi:hypothetical protein
VAAASVEDDWDLGVTAARIMAERAPRAAILAFKSRCSGARYLVVASKSMLTGLEALIPEAGEAYYASNSAGTWALLYPRSSLEKLYSMAARVVCGEAGGVG